VSADAIHPSRDAEQVSRGCKPHAHGFPGALLDVAIDVVIARDDEEPVQTYAEFAAQRAKKACGFVVFSGRAGLRSITGEEDEVDCALVFEQGFQVPPPGIAEDTATAPRLLFLGSLRVEVRYVEKL